MAKRRNSELQKQIIALLKEEQDLRVVDIAKKLKRQHSSISRSIKKLRERKIIVKSEDGRVRIANQAGKRLKITGLSTQIEIGRAIRRMARSYQEQGTLLNSLYNYQSLARLALPVVQAQSLGASFVKHYDEYLNQISKIFQSPLMDMASQITANANWLIKLQTIKPIELNMKPLFLNLAFLTKFESRLNDILKSNLLTTISSYNGFLQEAASNKTLTGPRIIDATTSFSGGLGAISHLISEASDQDEEIPKAPLCILGDEIDSLLEMINPEFTAIRRGAWNTFRSDGPDKNRQSSHSMRELLNQLLHALAPGKDLTRKERLRIILNSKSEMKLIDSIAEMVDNLYGKLSKVSHTNNNMDLHVSFLLATTENTVAYLLKIHFDLSN